MPSKNLNILGHVPAALRTKFSNYHSVLPVVLAPLLREESDDLSTQLGYIAGAITYQELVAEESSKVFKGTIKRVEEIKRESNGFLLGKKARIVFESAGQGGKVEEQTIDTGWVEFHGFGAHEEAFNVALANTIVEIAEENIGVECFIRKVMIEGVETSKGGSKVRFIGDLTPVDGGKSKKSSSGSRDQSKSRGSKRDESSEELTVGGFKAEAKSQKVDLGDFKTEDIEDILDGIEKKDVDGIAEIIAEIIDADVDAIAKDLDVDEFDTTPLAVVVGACK